MISFILHLQITMSGMGITQCKKVDTKEKDDASLQSIQCGDVVPTKAMHPESDVQLNEITDRLQNVTLTERDEGVTTKQTVTMLPQTATEQAKNIPLKNTMDPTIPEASRTPRQDMQQTVQANPLTLQVKTVESITVKPVPVPQHTTVPVTNIQQLSQPDNKSYSAVVTRYLQSQTTAQIGETTLIEQVESAEKRIEQSRSDRLINERAETKKAPLQGMQQVNELTSSGTPAAPVTVIKPAQPMTIVQSKTGKDNGTVSLSKANITQVVKDIPSPPPLDNETHPAAMAESDRCLQSETGETTSETTAPKSVEQVESEATTTAQSSSQKVDKDQSAVDHDKSSPMRDQKTGKHLPSDEVVQTTDSKDRDNVLLQTDQELSQSSTQFQDQKSATTDNRHFPSGGVQVGSQAHSKNDAMITPEKKDQPQFTEQNPSQGDQFLNANQSKFSTGNDHKSDRQTVSGEKEASFIKYGRTESQIHQMYMHTSDLNQDVTTLQLPENASPSNAVHPQSTQIDQQLSQDDTLHTNENAENTQERQELDKMDKIASEKQQISQDDILRNDENVEKTRERQELDKMNEIVSEKEQLSQDDNNENVGETQEKQELDKKVSEKDLHSMNKESLLQLLQERKEEINYKNQQLVQIRKELTREQQCLEEKNQELCQNSKQLMEKEQLLLQKDEQLGIKDKQLSESNLAMSQKDEDLLKKETRLKEKDQIICEKDEELKKKDKRLKGKDKAISQKDEELEKKDERLKLKDQTISQKDEEL